jgi:hypothetical protein
MIQDSKIRWLVATLAAAALAVTIAAPAGAWADPPGGRQDGNGIGSMPPQDVQKTILSNSVHEGVQADRRLGASVVAAQPVEIRSLGKTFIPGFTDSGAGVMLEVRQNLRDDVVTDKAAPAPSPIPYLSHGNGVPSSTFKTYIPGVTDSGTGVNRELGIDPTTVVATGEVSDDSFNWSSDLVIGISAALLTALLMALGTFALVHQRRRRVAL